MNEEAGFLSAIRQTPADETARLVYADWLDERGDPDSLRKAEFVRTELQMASAPEHSLNRIRWLNKLQKLAVGLSEQWLATVSHPQLEGCRVLFQFECPKQWGSLAPTADAKRRYCSSCKQHVHYCETIEEARNHAANGHCIAVSVVLARRRFDTRPPRPQPPRFLAPPRGRQPSPLRLVVARGLSVAGRISLPLAPSPAPEPPLPEPEPASETRACKNRGTKRDRRRKRNIQRDDWEELE